MFKTNKTNWKNLLILIVLTAIVSGGILGYSWWTRKELPVAIFPKEEKSEKEPTKVMKGYMEAFVKDYMDKESYSEYINMVGWTQKYMIEWTQKGHTGSLEAVKEEIKKTGQNPYEWFIRVGLRKPLPKNLKLPEVYKGYKVFVEAVGEIRAR